tara:strand:+ start:33443 stop:35428 length:1986 start_codon:yes stop_codon:yes gene_type:complete
LKIFLCILFSYATLVHAADTNIRWNSNFKETCHSQAEGAPVSFTVRTPPQIAGRKAYPLLIDLKVGLNAVPSTQYPFFYALPARGRIWGYRSLSTYDVLQVIDCMKQKYPIDPDRIYLTGFSAGGSGAMHLASCFPDQFAAVLALGGVGNNYPLVNFKNLPVAFHHGDEDWTSSICNARVQADRMQALGSPMFLKEYPDAGHSIPGPRAPLLNWLFKQKRNPNPLSLTHECESISLGRSYWFTIQEFIDPHQRASVAATINDRTVVVHPHNIAAFSLDLAAFPHVTTVQIDQTRLPADMYYRFESGHWINGSPLPKPPTRVYQAGAAANLYQGEPLLIVYGTRGDRTQQLKTLAQTLASYGGPTNERIPNLFPVIADRELTQAQQTNANLILVGTPTENRLSQAILSGLPIKIQQGTLLAGGRSPLPLENQILSLLAPHPDHPQRLVYLLAPFTDTAGLAQIVAKPASFLAGSDGFDRISQADLLTQNPQHLISRQLQYGKDWNWIRFPDADQPIPARYSNRANLATTCLQLMQEKSQADFALWWGPADRGMWGTDFNHLERYQPEFYTKADFLTRRRLFETMTGSVTGAELKEIWNRWGTKQELQSFPEITPGTLIDEQQYRLHVPMDLYIKLGQRKQNLINPQTAPGITSAELLQQIFP